MKFDTISVVGLGYIGLPTAAMFASRRRKVIGVDVNRHAIDTINRGQIHIVEPELDMIVSSVVREGYLRATARPEAADAFLIAVPTPFKGDHEPDLAYVQAAAESIAPVLRKGNLVILESTSPVGTTEQMAQWMAQARPDLTFPHQSSTPDVHVAYCPERVLPGRVVHELVQNDRVIGGMSAECSRHAAELYRVFVQGELLISNARTAEMCKLTENSFRDVNIAFANELSMICAKLDINVWDLIRLANRHPRVDILQPGCGVGGHCIAVDPWFIVSQAPEQAQLIKTARGVNNTKPHWVAEQVAAAADAFRRREGREPTVACFGLAFKADIDDLRESPAVEIAHELARTLRGPLLAVEPNVETLPAVLQAAGVALQDATGAVRDADILVLLVDHRPFKQIDRALLRGKTVIDTRGIWQERRGA